MKGIDKELYKYITNEIYPKYEKYFSHNLNHILNVTNNILMLAEYYNLDKNMCFVIASFHDLGLKTDRKNHERESGKILANDKILKAFFDENQINLMIEAVEDHRGSRKERPRSIYGECLSDSDRDFDINVLAWRQLGTSIKNYPNLKSFDEHFERCYDYISKRITTLGHFNLWTNNPTLVERRSLFEKKFFDKQYAKKIYKIEYDKLKNKGIIEKIKNYYEDF